jgi:hypothetical protein
VSSGVKSVYRYTYGMLTEVLFASESKDIDAPVHLGAVFAELQPLPDIGAFHGSDCKSPQFAFVLMLTVFPQQTHMSCATHATVPVLFGTYGNLTALANLSQSLQTAFANFAKDPMTSPAPNWPNYEPGIVGIAPVPTLAEIAYEGNMRFDDFIQPVQPISKVSQRNFYSKLICSSPNDMFYRRMDLALSGTRS